VNVLIVGAAGKTGRHVIAALRARPEPLRIRGAGRHPLPPGLVDDAVLGDLHSPDDRRRAVEGMDVVVHYAAAFDPRETAMGTGMIDAAAAAGVKRFIYISVIHPAIDDLLNHKAKLAVEAYLLNSDLDWTVVRPQHYMQNIDVPTVVQQGHLSMPFDTGTRLCHVDMVDVAEAVAKVVVEPGHAYAAYDLSSSDDLTVVEICDAISRAAGRTVVPRAIPPKAVIEHLFAGHTGSSYSIEALHRLFGYYERRGIRGNPNVASWLLGRPPGGFDAYVARRLAEAGAGAA
jgi:uncharacterized protein YbjT (DUF2867 family)